MHLFLKNKSNKTLLINLNGQSIILNPFGKDIFNINGNRVSLSLTTEDNYSSEKYAKKLGYYCFHRFVTVSQYDFTLENDLAVELYVETKKGDHFEAYQRVAPYCEDFAFPEPIYTLKDENEVKGKFHLNQKLERKAERLNGYFAFREILDNIILISLALGISALIFLAVWSNFSLKAAIITLAVIFFIFWLIFKIIEKFINRVGKTADKFFGSKLFNKAMDKANEKIEEKFVYCKDMPEELYKDENSFFDPNYIGAVFKYSNKNI